jgi:hypothetical protein
MKYLKNKISLRGDMYFISFFLFDNVFFTIFATENVII